MTRMQIFRRADKAGFREKTRILPFSDGEPLLSHLSPMVGPETVLRGRVTAYCAGWAQVVTNHRFTAAIPSTSAEVMIGALCTYSQSEGASSTRICWTWQ